MQVCYSSRTKASATNNALKAAVSSIPEANLRQVVETIAIPRHFEAEADSNRFVAQWISDQFQEFGYQTSAEGQYTNIVALPSQQTNTPLILVGAHYDSVPGSPGADDNASAVAALLAFARAVAQFDLTLPVCFVAFNREEDNLLGSTDFVDTYLPQSGLKIQEAHVLEMVGYCDHSPNSQHLPAELPIKIKDVGDFLGLIANSGSASLVDNILQQAATYLPDFPVLGLKVYFGLEKRLPNLERSDHTPFWRANIPAIMWTDTSEFRNPNYHSPADTPDTLDYGFLRSVTQVLLAYVLTRSGTFASNLE